MTRVPAVVLPLGPALRATKGVLRIRG